MPKNNNETNMIEPDITKFFIKYYKIATKKILQLKITVLTKQIIETINKLQPFCHKITTHKISVEYSMQAY